MISFASRLSECRWVESKVAGGRYSVFQNETASEAHETVLGSFYDNAMRAYDCAHSADLVANLFGPVDVPAGGWVRFEALLRPTSNIGITAFVGDAVDENYETIPYLHVHHVHVHGFEKKHTP